MLQLPHLRRVNQTPKTTDQIVISRVLIEKFIETCLRLDASIFEPYIDEEGIFENKEKYMFLAKLKLLFQPYQSLRSIASVRQEEKICLGCSKTKNVLKFSIYSVEDNQDIADFGFVIDTDNGLLKDIYQCRWYEQSDSYKMTSGCLEIKPEGLPTISIPGFY